MKVEIFENDTLIWMRNGKSLEGIASRGYMKDGTQQRIIAALEDALTQAKGEQSCWNDTDAVTYICSPTS